MAQGGKLLAFDVETTGLNLYQGEEIFAFATCDENMRTEVVRRRGSSRLFDRRLREIFSGDYILVCHNAKFDLTAVCIELGGLPPSLQFHDTMLQSCVYDNTHQTHSLKDLCYDLCGWPKDLDAQVEKWKKKGYENVPAETMYEYQVADVERTMFLHNFFYPKILKEGMEEQYQAELDLVLPTMRMEARGFPLHQENVKRLVEKYDRLSSDILQELRRLTGKSELNLNSNVSDVPWILFEFAKMDIVSRTKKTGKPATDKNTLFALRDRYEDWRKDIVESLLKWRSWSRGSTIIGKYPSFAGTDGIVHPNIKTFGATTGRESCSNPNLQNVSKSESLMNPYPVAAREAFRPRKGFVNIHMDYSGVEMRWALHYSGESELIQVLQEGGDVHLPGAKLFFDNWDDVDDKTRKLYRNAMKNVNFGIIYGAGPEKIMKLVPLPSYKVAEKYDKYKQRFPKLCGFSRAVVRQAEKLGYVTTAFGRKIRLGHEKPYKATNYLIQGTAADVIKRAQVRADKYVYSSSELKGHVFLLLPIHDEIVFEWSRKKLRVLRKHMRKIRDLVTDFSEVSSVPFSVDVEIATIHWALKSEVDLNAKEEIHRHKDTSLRTTRSRGSRRKRHAIHR